MNQVKTHDVFHSNVGTRCVEISRLLFFPSLWPVSPVVGLSGRCLVVFVVIFGSLDINNSLASLFERRGSPFSDPGPDRLDMLEFSITGGAYTYE